MESGSVGFKFADLSMLNLEEEISENSVEEFCFYSACRCFSAQKQTSSYIYVSLLPASFEMRHMEHPPIPQLHAVP